MNYNITSFVYNGDVDIQQYDFDIGLFGRLPQQHINSIQDICHYKENYDNHGVCVVDRTRGQATVQDFLFEKWQEGAGKDQGKCWQLITLGDIKIIHASLSFQEDNVDEATFVSQATELLDNIDDDTLIVSDFHYTDDHIEQWESISFVKRKLTNHLMNHNTFQGADYQIGLDKLLTTASSKLIISNVKVIEQPNRQGHWPIQFSLGK